MGKAFIILGFILIVIGTLFIFKVPFAWLGRLPGDFSQKIGNISLYIPLATSLIISVALSFIFFIIRLFCGK